MPQKGNVFRNGPRLIPVIWLFIVSTDRGRSIEVSFYTNSQAALNGLGTVEIHSQAVKDCMYSLIQLAEHNSITLKWVRGHQGHKGNERADFLAKAGTEVRLIGPGPTCSLAYRTARRAIKDLLREKHTSYWTKVPGLRQSRMLLANHFGISQ
ncbi:hypothetical protein NQ318_011877 [Aromia moschata]|uniref:RNase H type-1 domain-containing protein n=1 Tax=Aromia moschata TaxID=1265417 RepID=A0AAV8XW43_9CUCU|nr:hypothetical protein NQ318_011877 [Aromia moschata]